MATIVSALTGPILEILNKFIPDPAQKAEAKLALEQLNQQTIFKQIDTQAAQDASQADINKVEASNENLFISGWRPFIGWICGVALGYHFILQPLIIFMVAAFSAAAAGHKIELPVFDMSSLNTILMGLLGLGSLRSVEKIAPMVMKK